MREKELDNQPMKDAASEYRSRSPMTSVASHTASTVYSQAESRRVKVKSHTAVDELEEGELIESYSDTDVEADDDESEPSAQY